MRDRRDHFESLKDVFAMFRIIARERKRREIEPPCESCAIASMNRANPRAAAPYTRERLAELPISSRLPTNAYEQMEKLPDSGRAQTGQAGDQAFSSLASTRV